MYNFDWRKYNLQYRRALGSITQWLNENCTL